MNTTTKTSLSLAAIALAAALAACQPAELAPTEPAGILGARRTLHETF
jgi:hypothetical protein